jgi:hypothetical protein
VADSAGTIPPKPSSTRMEIVPPVKKIAILGFIREKEENSD